MAESLETILEDVRTPEEKEAAIQATLAAELTDGVPTLKHDTIRKYLRFYTRTNSGEIGAVRELLTKYARSGWRPVVNAIKRAKAAAGEDTTDLDALYEEVSTPKTYVEPSTTMLKRAKTWTDLTGTPIRATSRTSFLAWVVQQLIQIAPVRTQVFTTTRLIPSAQGLTKRGIPLPANYIDMKTGDWVVRDYKTARTYGDRKFKIPKTILNYIARGRKLYKTTTDFLITNPTGTGANGNFSRWVSRTPLGVGSSVWRPAFVAHHITPETTLAERERYASLLAHSMTEQEFTYRQYNPPFKPED